VIPADEILEALDLSRAEPGSGFLEALFARFNAAVPFENVSKIARNADIPNAAARPRTPDVFWADHLALGTGGTCFARVAAFDALLRELGFRTRRTLGRVRNPNDHAALVVETPAGERIADVGFPLPALLPLESGLVETPTVGLRVEAGEAGFEVAFEGGVPEGPRTLWIGKAPVEEDEYLELWRKTFRPDAPFLQEVWLRRDLGHRVLAFARGEARVDDLCSRLVVPLASPRSPSLGALFGIDEALLARAFALAGDPAPAAADPSLTAYLETSAPADRAYETIASPEGYRRLQEGVAPVGGLRETANGFRLTLSGGGGTASDVTEEVSLDPAALRVTVARRGSAASSEQLSSYRAERRDGRTWLVREARLPGSGEDLLRNDGLRGRLAAALAVDLLGWARML